MMTKDKLQHCLSGIVAVQAAFLAGLWFGFSAAGALLFASGIAITAMAGKEVIWDGLMKKGVPSLRDFLAGMIGILYGFIVTMAHALIK